MSQTKISCEGGSKATAFEALIPSTSEQNKEIATKHDNVQAFVRDAVENVVPEAIDVLSDSPEEGNPLRNSFSETSLYSDSSLIFEGDTSKKARVTSQPESARNSCQENPEENDEESEEEETNLGKKLFRGAGSRRQAISLQGEPDSVFTTDAVHRSFVRAMHMQLQRPPTMDCEGNQSEELARIVKGLGNIQIGDSSSVLPSDDAGLEKQVKRAVRSIDDWNTEQIEDPAEMLDTFSEGQGDVDGQVRQEPRVMEPWELNSDGENEQGAVGNIQREEDEDLKKQKNDYQKDGSSKVPTRCLHKLIQELEIEDGSADKSVDSETSEWEEHEEQLIKIIDKEEEEVLSSELCEESPKAGKEMIEVVEKDDTENAEICTIDDDDIAAAGPSRMKSFRDSSSLEFDEIQMEDLSRIESHRESSPELIFDDIDIGEPSNAESNPNSSTVQFEEIDAAGASNIDHDIPSIGSLKIEGSMRAQQSFRDLKTSLGTLPPSSGTEKILIDEALPNLMKMEDESLHRWKEEEQESQPPSPMHPRRSRVSTLKASTLRSATTLKTSTLKRTTTLKASTLKSATTIKASTLKSATRIKKGFGGRLRRYLSVVFGRNNDA